MAGRTCRASRSLDLQGLRLFIITATTVLMACQAVEAQMGSGQCPFSPNIIDSSLERLKALVDRCAGLHGVKMGVPWDCQQFVVCCSGVPLTYTCHAPWDPDRYEYIVSISVDFISHFTQSLYEEPDKT